jgi:ferrochelatase
VRRYLAEFLSDPRVIPLPRWLWLPILYGIVLNLRPARSAGKYSLIWTAEGSPLAVHTARQTQLLRRAIPQVKVEYAMRYGEPSIASMKGFDRVVPLYPQYSDSATGSVLDVLPQRASFVRDFHDHPMYIEALAANVRRHRQQHGDSPMLVMSFHGLPKRGAEVYAAQCRTTAKLLADRLRLNAGAWRVTFQSRFGFAEWLQPYTQPTLVEMAKAGTKRVDVVCPGFVADCLETLEEMGITARAAFLAAGGREFHLVPCLNESPEWIAALARIARG